MSLSRYEGAGFSGESYDRNVFEASLSTVNKLQRDYWTAKQVIRKKLGKADDQCIISSDSELDAKLDLFRSIQKTCADLIKAVERYQTCICVLSRDENAMGRFLKDQGALDKTPAGKIMAAVGKAQCYSAQQRLNLRHPLGRLHHDVETFRYRAVGDSVLSVDQMEEARTHYRASLRWMQDISSNLDPEQYKKLEKFRKVQNEVRLNKEKFDRLKWGVCQKVDLLCASRSNLFSNILIPYQDELIKLWDKTTRTLSAVLENIKDCQHYEFKLLKELDAAKSTDEEKKAAGDAEGVAENDLQLISLSDQEVPEDEGGDAAKQVDDLFEGLALSNGSKDADNRQSDTANDDVNLLFGDLETTDFQQPSKEDLDLFNNMLGDDSVKSVSNQDDFKGAGDLETEWHSVFGEFMQSGSDSTAAGISSQQPASADLAQIQAPGVAATPAGYLPSQLMDMMMAPQGYQVSGAMSQTPMNMQMYSAGPMGFPSQRMSMPQGMLQPPSYQSMFGQTSKQITGQQNKGPQMQQSKGQGNMSAWFNLFAELDPLQNPDALGKKKDGGKKVEGGAC